MTDACVGASVVERQPNDEGAAVESSAVERQPNDEGAAVEPSAVERQQHEEGQAPMSPWPLQPREGWEEAAPDVALAVKPEPAEPSGLAKPEKVQANKKAVALIRDLVRDTDAKRSGRLSLTDVASIWRLLFKRQRSVRYCCIIGAGLSVIWLGLFLYFQHLQEGDAETLNYAGQLRYLSLELGVQFARVLVPSESEPSMHTCSGTRYEDTRCPERVVRDMESIYNSLLQGTKDGEGRTHLVAWGERYLERFRFIATSDDAVELSQWPELVTYVYESRRDADLTVRILEQEARGRVRLVLICTLVRGGSSLLWAAVVGYCIARFVRPLVYLHERSRELQDQLGDLWHEREEWVDKVAPLPPPHPVAYGDDMPNTPTISSSSHHSRRRRDRKKAWDTESSDSDTSQLSGRSSTRESSSFSIDQSVLATAIVDFTRHFGVDSFANAIAIMWQTLKLLSVHEKKFASQWGSACNAWTCAICHATNDFNDLVCLVCRVDHALSNRAVKQKSSDGMNDACPAVLGLQSL